MNYKFVDQCLGRVGPGFDFGSCIRMNSLVVGIGTLVVSRM